MNKQGNLTIPDLEKEVEDLRQQLEEARELIHAIRTGEVDALAVQGENGPQIYTLKSADHTYRVLVEEMNEGAITLNKEGIIIYSNMRFANLIGVSLSNVIGAPFLNFISNDYTPLVDRIISKGYEGSSKGEILIRRLDGESIPVSLSIKPLPNFDAEVLGIIITDLSAQKEIDAVKSQVKTQNLIISHKDAELKKEKQQKEEAERFRLLLEGIPHMTWTNLPNGEMNFYNQRLFDYTGTTFEQIQESGWELIIHPEDLANTINNYQTALNKEIPFDLENRYRRASDGQYRWHLNRAMPIRNNKGEVILWVGTATDIHDQKTAKQNLDAANIELSEKNIELSKINNDLDNFIYTASHDLKAPVSNIEGLISTLSDELATGGIGNESIEYIINLINTSIKRFKLTILDLTEITKIQKEIHEDVINQDFREIIEDVKSSINDIIIKSNAKIHIDTSACPSINFSKKNLKSIVYNLVSNAVKYCSFDKDPDIQITTERKDEYILLLVKDNGLGMDLSRNTKIFSMFKRLHDHVEGTGVGLYIVKRIIDNSGGKIEVESEVGKGTTFKVYFKEIAA